MKSENRSRIQRVERREQREQEPTQVARLFLLQSISPESVDHNISVQDLSFTRMLFIRKAGKVNAGQLMPVGGKIDVGENPRNAALREAIEESHLRPPEEDFHMLRSTYEYSFQHSSGERHNKSYHAIGRLLPSPLDVAYALDQQEDKIDRFVQVSLREFQQLQQTGAIERDGEHMPILDSLNTNEQAREAHGTQANQQEIEHVWNEVGVNFQIVEAAKKMRILLQVKSFLPNHRMTKQEREDIQGYAQHALEKLNAFYHDDLLHEGKRRQAQELAMQIDDYWKVVSQQLHLTHHDIEQALDMSNTEVSIRYASREMNMETGEGLPSLTLLFPLLFSANGSSPDYSHIKKVAQNPHLAHLLRVSSIANDIQLLEQAHGEERELIEDRIRRRAGLHSYESVDEQAIVSGLFSEGLFESRLIHSFDELSEEVNTFFSYITREADPDPELSLQQLPEVASAEFRGLLHIALHPVDDTEEQYSRGQRRRWEARRKLLLMMMMNEVWNSGDAVLEREILPIRKTEHTFLFSDSTSNGHIMKMRDAHGKDTNRLCSVYQREKSLVSFFRKVIVRDIMPSSSEMEDMVKDVFAESIVFSAHPESVAEDMEYVSIPVHGRVYDPSGTPLEHVEAPRLLGEMLQNYLQNPDINIVGYKGLPQDGRIQSHGPGGGANIRLAKFYVRHTEREAKQQTQYRYQEVQVYLPKRSADGTWVSGETDFLMKKSDDYGYAMKRLFFPKYEDGRVRSFMELMFPGEIYGEDVRPVFRDSVSNRKIAQRNGNGNGNGNKQ